MWVLLKVGEGGEVVAGAGVEGELDGGVADPEVGGGDVSAEEGSDAAFGSYDVADGLEDVRAGRCCGRLCGFGAELETDFDEVEWCR